MDPTEALSGFRLIKWLPAISTVVSASTMRGECHEQPPSQLDNKKDRFGATNGFVANETTATQSSGSSAALGVSRLYFAQLLYESQQGSIACYAEMLLEAPQALLGTVGM